MFKLSKLKNVTAMLVISTIASFSLFGATAAMAKPVADFIIIISKQGGKPSSFKTGKNGYVWQVVEAGKYVVKAGGKEIVVQVGREGKLWIKVDQNAKGKTTLSADGGAEIESIDVFLKIDG
jgi:hypothetical protein